MTTFTTVETRPIERDQWGRYRLPDLVTGKVKSWTRVTTVSRTLADRFGLERWMQRNIVYGIGMRPDLYARAAAAKPGDDGTLAEVVDKAQEAAAASSAAVMGSAVHQFTERVDRGEELTIPSPMDADVSAYRKAMKAAGIEVIPEWIERVVGIADLGIAGTVDRLVAHAHNPRPRVGDVKTGKDVERYGMAEIPLQLALYANASHWWDGEAWHEMPAVDLSTGIVMHVPAGQGRCTLYAVDLEAGWEAVQLALAVRKWRTRKGLCEEIPAVTEGMPVAAGDGEGEPAVSTVAAQAPSPSTNGQPDQASTPSKGAGKGDEDALPPSEDSPAPDPARLSWCRDRVDAIKASDAVGKFHDMTPKKQLAGLWSLMPEIPTFPKGGPRTDAEIDAIAGMCELVEMEFQLPFGTPDPTLPLPTKAQLKGKRSDA